MRFRSRTAENPGVEVGQTVALANPIEEWANDSARVRPDRVTRLGARVGVVLRVQEPRPQDGRPWWDVIADDPDPVRTTVEVVLTIIGPRTLAPMDKVAACLEALTARSLPTEAHRAAAAARLTAHLASCHPALNAVARHLPTYDDPGDYLPFLDGVRAVSGYDSVHVPFPRMAIDLSDLDRLATDLAPGQPLRAADDVTERLRRDHRAN